MSRDARRARHEQWLLDLTTLPTAAGREGRVVEWIRGWTARRRHLVLREDRAGNLLITRAPASGGSGRRSSPRPLFITAHLDHPAFVVRGVASDGRTIDAEFRGGVHPPYFDDARVELFDEADGRHPGRIEHLDAEAEPFKRVTIRMSKTARGLAPGDVGRWAFGGRVPRITNGLLHTHACDDLAAVAAALATMDRLARVRDADHVGLLFTRAEEVGFIGAIEACRQRSVPKTARLVCLENSRSFAESPIGGGPILRVGDRLSVFEPNLTNRIGMVLTEHARTHAEFRWQRKLMPGGACEATAFSVYGYESTCVCLPLGNYHNMTDIDAVQAGKRPAKVGPEVISVADYHGMIELLTVVARTLDSADTPDLKQRLEGLREAYGHVLG